jgi:exonuclease VII small subunit
MENFNELREIINKLEDDAIKFYDKGNKAAGVRLRKGLQEIKSLAQIVRQEVSTKNRESN